MKPRSEECLTLLTCCGSTAWQTGAEMTGMLELYLKCCNGPGGCSMTYEEACSNMVDPYCEIYAWQSVPDGDLRTCLVLLVNGEHEALQVRIHKPDIASELEIRLRGRQWSPVSDFGYAPDGWGCGTLEDLILYARRRIRL